MFEEVKSLLSEGLKGLESVSSTKELADYRVRVLGKSGALTLIMRQMKELPPESRPAFGKEVNEAKEQLESAAALLEATLKDKELAERLARERLDITVPGVRPKRGSLHPLSIIRSRITDFFIGLGFEVSDGPEIESDYYNFEALNIPGDHPARDAQDTLYITDKFLLRTQTSAAQIRTMEVKKPPIKMICPGRVYRADEVDATHSPMFHQIEGLVVDKNVNMCDLKGILDAFAAHIFGEKTKTRLRPSYFPFTEPSVEVDATCSRCGGSGCRTCKGTGWVEILGAGIVNRRVLSGCGVDPDEYSGFAFGMGLDRITNICFGITDLRVVFENDLRFLAQFARQS